MQSETVYQVDAAHCVPHFTPQVKRVAHQFQGGQKAAGQLANGLADGIWTFWHPNGRLDCEGTYEEGAKNGLWTFWYPEGPIDSMGEYRDDIEDGPWSSWYANGQVQEEGVFLSGRKIGKWKYWSEDGRALSEVDYGGISPPRHKGAKEIQEPRIHAN